MTITFEEAKDVATGSAHTLSSYDLTTTLQIVTTQVTVTSTQAAESVVQSTNSAPPALATTTGASSSAFVITNPLPPGWSSTISDWSVLNPHINNTSTDTGTYLNISTFSMGDQSTTAPAASTTLVVGMTSGSSEPSSRVIHPSATAAGTTNNALVPGFTAAATSNIGKNAGSGEMAPSGMVHICAVGATLLALCFGVMVWL